MTTTFSLKGRVLTLNSRADIEPHLAELRALPKVEEVHLSGNTVGIEAAQALAEVLATLKELKLADLSDIFTGRLITEIPQALTAMCDALKDSTTLHTINLSDNAFGGRVVEPMVPFLSTNTSLRHFILTNNGLGPAGASVVAAAIRANPGHNLVSVVCGRNRCENGSAEAWADAFAALPNLQEVRMPQNGIRAEGITQIVDALAKCPKLRILDLQDNTFCKRDVEPGTVPPNGTRALARALPSWPDLELLNLSDCILGRRESIALALALGKGTNKKIQVLKMQYDELDHRALSLLAKAIHDHLSELTTLEINGNIANAEDECIQNIKDALEAHGHADALDELDDMEEAEDDDDEEGVDSAQEDDDDEEKKEKEQKSAGNLVAQKAVDAADELADLIGKVSISK
ncbi:RNI-like protein [Exidia glandulosa HHB12029]|uniref:RNI-like protein n=1 Tax=Exidia glandulosa HHB12029 TaxID=1314781 RepID=A0A165MA31_EXIGL|nr:RNI-like protein [Exidia glandulosa HHB12029]